jgi:hypothetical protein
MTGAGAVAASEPWDFLEDIMEALYKLAFFPKIVFFYEHLGYTRVAK